MNKKELTDYLCIIKDLESSLQEQQEVEYTLADNALKWGDGVKQKIESLKPKEPHEYDYNASEPSRCLTFDEYFSFIRSVFIFIITFFPCALIGGLFSGKFSAKGVFILLVGIPAFTAIFGPIIINIFDEIRYDRSHAKWAESENLKKFEAAQEKYEKDLYEWEHKDYNYLYEPYRTNWNNAVFERGAVRDKTEKLLKEYYDVNIIHPKYRNFVAICSIYEYFETGRCNTLEGPDGAYNIYEQESRLDRIISDLAEIKSSLEQIKNNQFVLYTCMQNIANNVERLGKLTMSQFNLIANIASNTAYSSYYNRITAFNTTAEENKVRFGILAGLNKYNVSVMQTPPQISAKWDSEGHRIP